MSIGGVVINFTARTAAAVADVDRLTGRLNAAARSSHGAGRGMKLGLAGGLAAATGGLAAVGYAMKEFAEGAWADHQSAEALADTLGKIPGITQAAADGVEDWVGAMQLAWLVADTDLRKAIGALSLATGDLGEAQRLAAAAADLATVANKDFNAVAGAMAKAAAGNTSALKRLAPWLDTNRDGTLTLAEALGQLEGKFVDAAEAAADRDPFERIKVIFGEIGESLGQFAVPLLEKLSDWMKDAKNQKALQGFIDRLGEWSTLLGEKLLPYLENFYKWVTSEEGKAQLRQWGEAAKDAAGGFVAVVNAIKDIIDWWEKLPADLGVRLGEGEQWLAPTETNMRRTTPALPADTPGARATAELGRRLGPATMSTSSRPSVTVNNYYPKPETAAQGTALALRLSRTVGF